jgi:chromosome segregation ATPase
MDPPELRRGLFGYSAKSVRRFLAAREQTPGAEGDPATGSLAHELEELEEEVEILHSELAAQVASRGAAEADARETEERAVAAEARTAELDAELQAAGEVLGRLNEELRAIQERVASLEPKLTVLRSALTREMQSVWAADRRIYEMGAELATAQEELMTLAGRLATEANRADMAEARAARAEEEAARHSNPWTEDEVASMFEIAEQAVARIIQEARRRGEDELRAVELERARIQEEIGDLLAWRERIEPLVDPLQESVEEAEAEAERLGALIGEALGPMTIAVSALGGRLRDLAAATAEVQRRHSAIPDIDLEGAPSEEASESPNAGEADRIVDVSEERTEITPSN